MFERISAIALANRLMDEPNCDPDDDLRVLSRQLLRRSEEIERLRAGLQLIADDEHKLMSITARQTAASILQGKQP